MNKIYIMDRDTIAKEIIPYLHKDVYPILTNEIPSKTKGKYGLFLRKYNKGQA